MKIVIGDHEIDIDCTISVPDTRFLPMPLIHFLGITLLAFFTTAALH